MLPMAMAFLFLFQTAPPPSSQPAKAEVAVDAPLLLVPRLPVGMEEARRQYGALSRQAKVDLDYLGQVLAGLYRLQPTGATLQAGTLSLPRTEAPCARGILKLIEDPTYAALEQEVIVQRKAWEADMKPGAHPQGPGKPQEAALPKPPPSALEAQARRIAEARAALFDQGSAAYDDKAYWGPLPLYHLPNRVAAVAPPPSAIYCQQIFEMDAAAKEHTAERLAFAQVTTQHLERLTRAFDRLRSNLDETTLEAANLLVDPPGTKPSDSLLGLQRALKILLMERLRSCMFFSWEIWADLASHPLPDPLPNLAPKTATLPPARVPAPLTPAVVPQ